MWFIWMPAIDLSISPAKCGTVPLPPEPKFICPGFDLAYAMNSFTLLAGTDGCTNSIIGADAIVVIG